MSNALANINPYFDTLNAAINGAALIATALSAKLRKPDDLWDIGQKPLYYGEVCRVSLELDAFHGKPTRKYFHVVIYRLTSGRYELTAYTL